MFTPCPASGPLVLARSRALVARTGVVVSTPHLSSLCQPRAAASALPPCQLRPSRPMRWRALHIVPLALIVIKEECTGLLASSPRRLPSLFVLLRRRSFPVEARCLPLVGSTTMCLTPFVSLGIATVVVTIAAVHLFLRSQLGKCLSVQLLCMSSLISLMCRGVIVLRLKLRLLRTARDSLRCAVTLSLRTHR